MQSTFASKLLLSLRLQWPEISFLDHKPWRQPISTLFIIALKTELTIWRIWLAVLLYTTKSLHLHFIACRCIIGENLLHLQQNLHIMLLLVCLNQYSGTIFYHYKMRISLHGNNKTEIEFLIENKHHWPMSLVSNILFPDKLCISQAFSPSKTILQLSRPRSDVAKWNIWSESTLFSLSKSHPQKNWCKLKM